ncbi:UDP-glucose 4-epimerase GalE [Candidatus Gracilibacteria bacterium]|nr:UDP-glucose 4-epimerase GalE [Candidatus Gracilibacteria bacterium]
MKKILLITGGMGYIGSHAVVAFEQAGYRTVIVDNLYNSDLSTYEGIGNILGYKPDFHELDLRNKNELEEIFKKYDFDGVLHFAGLKAPFESQEKPVLYFQNNISGSLNLFELMNTYDVKNIVFSSSASTYSTVNVPPITEKCNQVPETPYATSKFVGEKILEDLSKFSGFRSINLRYFNPVGCHPSGHIGEYLDDIPNNLFPYIFQVLSGRLPSLKVFGSDYDTLDGTGVRDYIDVVDLVDAHVLAYKKLSGITGNFGFNDSFNVGTGKGTSVLQAIDVVETVVGKKVEYSMMDRRPGDIPVSYCNTNKIQIELGWKSLTSLEQSIQNSWKFYNKQ